MLYPLYLPPIIFLGIVLSTCGLDVSHLCIILYKIYFCVIYNMSTLLPIKYAYMSKIYFFNT